MSGHGPGVEHRLTLAEVLLFVPEIGGREKNRIQMFFIFGIKIIKYDQRNQFVIVLISNHRIICWRDQ